LPPGPACYRLNATGYLPACGLPPPVLRWTPCPGSADCRSWFLPCYHAVTTRHTHCVLVPLPVLLDSHTTLPVQISPALFYFISDYGFCAPALVAFMHRPGACRRLVPTRGYLALPGSRLTLYQRTRGCAPRLRFLRCGWITRHYRAPRRLDSALYPAAGLTGCAPRSPRSDRTYLALRLPWFAAHRVPATPLHLCRAAAG